MSSVDDAGWGPTVRGRGRRRLRPGRWLVLLVVLVVLLLVGAAVWLNLQIPRERVDGLARGSGPTHVLVTGSDSRAGLSPEEQRELTIGRDDGSPERADTIFVMTIDGDRVALLAFPRDLWVERCDGSQGRINVAIAIEHGPSCMVETVRRVSGLPIHHHVQVTFGGFRDVVDAVGGVELCLDEPIADRDAGIDLPSGCQTLDGVDALGYVRVRKIDDDLQRIQRQQQFVRALAGEILDLDTMLNPVELFRLSREVGGAVTVDHRLGPVSAVRLARGGRGLAAGAAVTHTVPVTPTFVGAAAALELDRAAAEPLFRSFADGTVLDEVSTSGLTPEDVPVRVLNGAGVSGLAGQVAGQLEQRGHPVVGVGNAEPQDVTVVAHPPGAADAAEVVVEGLPSRPTLQEADVAEVTVTLGRDVAG